jgi:hypothetical protein
MLSMTVMVTRWSAAAHSPAVSLRDVGSFLRLPVLHLLCLKQTRVSVRERCIYCRAQQLCSSAMMMLLQRGTVTMICHLVLDPFVPLLSAAFFCFFFALNRFRHELMDRHAQQVTSNTSQVTRHTSHVTRHTSHVTRHTSHVTLQLP